MDERRGGLYTADAIDLPDPISLAPVPAVDPVGPTWLVWQVIDSAFPVGGFAHSGGLEAAVQLGFVNSADDLAGFVRTALWQSAKLACPFVVATVNDPNQFANLNQRYDILTINTVANAASRAQGAAVLSAGQAILNDATIAAARAAIRTERGFTHLPPPLSPCSPPLPGWMLRRRSAHTYSSKPARSCRRPFA